MVLRRPLLRLLADDLTGALDSAAAFASRTRPVAVRWRGAPLATGAIAIDSRTREASADEARAAIRAVAPVLFAPGTGLPFKKIDSLLRGQEAVELAAIVDLAKPARCIVAPAFPAQRRVTRNGRQHVLTDGGVRPVSGDLAGELERAGHPVRVLRAGDPVPRGVSLWDAETDADLDLVVAAAAEFDDVLWVGSAGLSSALARNTDHRLDQVAPKLPRPVLGLVGSEHEVVRTQLLRLGDHHSVLDARSASGDGAVAARLATDGVAFASVDLPAGISRRDAAAAIEARFGALLATLERPGTLFAAGGETLRGLCDALGADRLDVVGEVAPGVPCSILSGGRWDGVTVVSKSGAFGGPNLLSDIFAGKPAPLTGAAA